MVLTFEHLPVTIKAYQLVGLARPLQVADLVRNLMPLAGRTVDIDGQRLHIGALGIRPLDTADTLHAPRVAVRECGDDDAGFDSEIQRQLERMEISARVSRGKRRVLRIADRPVVTHALRITGLDAEDSIHLQEAGLGDAHKMGCGVLTPHADEDIRG